MFKLFAVVSLCIYHEKWRKISRRRSGSVSRLARHCQGEKGSGPPLHRIEKNLRSISTEKETDEGGAESRIKHGEARVFTPRANATLWHERGCAREDVGKAITFCLTMN